MTNEVHKLNIAATIDFYINLALLSLPWYTDIHNKTPFSLNLICETKVMM